MANFTESVGIFMSTPVHTIGENSTISAADAKMVELDLTSLGVVNDAGELTGVITSTDLIASGLRNAASRPDSSLLEPVGLVSSIMSAGVISVDIESSMASAAALMVSKRVHRVFVTAQGDLAGVLSTSDVMAAVEAVRPRVPVSQIMSAPVFTIRASETIGMATERLQNARVTGLIVVDESEWPVGVFGQREALEAREESRSTPVESAMNPAVLTLPDQTAVYNVARQALAMNARRVAVMNRHELVGVLTGVDFAKAIS
jgi:predicted transcriptional regulator